MFLYFEYWELDPPQGAIYDKRHDGALGGLFPNYKVHSQYEYGNRVGIFRVLDLLDRHKLPVTVAANAGACENYPYLVRAVPRARLRVRRARRVRDTHSLEPDERSRGARRDRATRSTRSSARPARGRAAGSGRTTASRPITPQLLAEAGLRYVADWGNDDQPYLLNTTPAAASRSRTRPNGTTCR